MDRIVFCNPENGWTVARLSRDDGSLPVDAVGILLGWTISFVVGQIAMANNADIIPVIGVNDVLLATLFSAGVGLFFGLYPANRAASLEPVEALRYE